MIDIKSLRKTLETSIKLAEWNKPSNDKDISDRIIIKRKKKIILEETPNGSVKSKRRNVIQIEITE